MLYKNVLIIKTVFCLNLSEMLKNDQFDTSQQKNLMQIGFSGIIDYDTFSVTPSIINKINKNAAPLIWF